MDTVELEEVFRFPKWTPLSAIVGPIQPDHFFNEGLYCIGHSLYLGASPWCGPQFEIGPGGPFVTEVIWAAGDNALRRVTEGDIEGDRGMIALVPRPFLPARAEATYKSIADTLKHGQLIGCLETASYRIAKDDRFLYRSIESHSFRFHFRGRKYDDQEAPFVAICILPEG